MNLGTKRIQRWTGRKMDIPPPAPACPVLTPGAERGGLSTWPCWNSLMPGHHRGPEPPLPCGPGLSMVCLGFSPSQTEVLNLFSPVVRAFPVMSLLKGNTVLREKMLRGVDKRRERQFQGGRVGSPGTDGGREQGGSQEEETSCSTYCVSVVFSTINTVEVRTGLWAGAPWFPACTHLQTSPATFSRENGARVTGLCGPRAPALMQPHCTPQVTRSRNPQKEARLFPPWDLMYLVIQSFSGDTGERAQDCRQGTQLGNRARCGHGGSGTGTEATQCHTHHSGTWSHVAQTPEECLRVPHLFPSMWLR